MLKMRLMIIWGLLMSVWLCKSLFAGDTQVFLKTEITAETVSETAFETVSETTSETVTSETLFETRAEMTVKQSENILPQKIENYVAGVVAAEMPVYFPPEALKAQAVAARTYAFREYSLDPNVDLYSIGQAYLSENELKQRWGSDFEKNRQKVVRAVKDTEGEIIMYDDEPILAAFCSASGGMTENSENVWGSALPYLRSVESGGDRKAPVYSETKTFALSNLAAALGVNDASDIRVTKRSGAGYVLSVNAGGREFEGGEISSILGLRSSDFDIKLNDGAAEFTAYGYGHGVGMSQYGAKAMAEDGAGYGEILGHYYTGVYLERFVVK